MATGHDSLRRLLESGVMAIVRIDAPDAVLPTLQALMRAGVDTIEISLLTPGALGHIERIHRELGDAVAVGAGTVLDAESTRSAILAGADFIVSPIARPRVATLARRYDRLCLLGAYTPGECVAAWEAGADAIYLFPAMPAGPEYVKAIHAPLPQIRLVPVGGVVLENVGSFIRAGAVAVAGATRLADPALVRAGRFDEITSVAEGWIKAAREVRAR